jgi:hypothetical protein
MMFMKIFIDTCVARAWPLVILILLDGQNGRLLLFPSTVKTNINKHTVNRRCTTGWPLHSTRSNSSLESNADRVDGFKEVKI